MSDFYIPKDHLQELFLFSTENLFLIFQSVLSIFLHIFVRKSAFYTTKNRGTHLGFFSLFYFG